ncbi:alpha/beta hydrolase [Owenweeksia hongkongensis]|uniref:alpha/beta hydrolase n=1 Tax=Owenweeksia hongkongensis TaxID=253245 RepID=UPI003A934D2E
MEKSLKSLFKTEQGKSEVLSLYDQKLEELNIDYEYIQVETSFGKTNIIATGDASNPPIIIIHGSNGCAPIALETYPNLSKHFRVYAVDVIAQPNKSAETRPSMKDDSYGKWMNEVIDQLNITDVTLAGFSFGGLVILKTLEHDESKIKEVFLSAPAYIVNGNPLKALFKIFIPMRRYMRSGKPKFVEAFLKDVFTDRDEFAIKYLSKVFMHFTMDFTPVPVVSKEKARLIKTPITLIAAKHDVIFPGEKMIKRATQIFPSLKESVLLKNSKHVQSPQDNRFIENLILEA